MQFRRIALRLERICAHSDCAWIASRQVGTLGRGSSAILSKPRNPRNWVFGLFAILPQSFELRINCRFKAILTQFRRIPTKCHQSTQDCLGIAIKQESDWNLPRQNRKKISQKSQDGDSDRNLRNHLGLRRDCKTAKDCQGIERIASESW